MVTTTRIPAVLLGVVGVALGLQGVRGYLAATPVQGPRIGYLLEVGLLAHLLVGGVVVAIAVHGFRSGRPTLPATVLAGAGGVWIGLRLDVFGRFPNTQLALGILTVLAFLAASPSGSSSIG